MREGLKGVRQLCRLWRSGKCCSQLGPLSEGGQGRGGREGYNIPENFAKALPSAFHGDVDYSSQSVLFVGY